MENRKGSGIFLGVIGVATLVVAIIGATFAYFSATATSDFNAVTAASTSVALGYEDTTGTNLKSNLIPASDTIAIYAANSQTGTGSTANNQCIDDNGNEVCSVYQFTIGNPSLTTAQGISGTMEIAVNTFKNLKYAIYEIDSTGTLVSTPVVAATPLATRDGSNSSTYQISLSALNQTLEPSSSDSGTLSTSSPSSYTLVTAGTSPNFRYNKRTYRIIFWIFENGADNSNDESKNFAAQIRFDNGTTGVTGVISNAS